MWVQRYEVHIMGLPVIVVRNSLQAPSTEAVKEARVTNAVTGLYTVPAGKIAIVTSITGLQDALGTDATGAIGVQFTASDFRPLSTFITATVPNNFVQWDGLIQLVAGDIITEEGDAGATNHTWDMTASVKEFNA